jgi:hypothetical protein
LVERGDGDTGVVDGRALWIRALGVQGLDEAIEHPTTPIPPPRRVQRDGQLAQASSVDVVERTGELQDIGSAIEPLLECAPDRGLQLAAPIAEQLLEEVLAVVEVVGDAGIRHADHRRNRTDLHRGHPSLGQQVRGRVEDDGASLFRGSSCAQGGHVRSLP